MIKNGKKKGFTIVELVIVIAVIAILAAVLIPTFSNIVDKANTSADVNVVKNLNTILLAESAGEGKNATMTDALKDAEENGYTVEKLTPTNSKNEILWDSLNDCFVLKENGATELNYCGVATTETNVADYQYFKIYNTKSPLSVGADGTVTSEYSIYLGTGAIADSVTALTVDKGIDVGDTKLTSISYKNSGDKQENIIIRTNSYDTAVTVNAPLDTVMHYDKASSVAIEDVAGKSYHEYGDIQGNITLEKGRAVVEQGSYASAVVVKTTVEQVEAGTIVAVDNTASKIVPIVIPQNVKTAIEAKAAADSNYSGGIKTTEDSTVITNDSEIEQMKKFTGGIGTKESPYLIANVDQWANLCQSDSSFIMGNNHFKVISDLNFSQNITEERYFKNYCVKNFQGSVDFGNHSVTATNVTATEAVSLFYYTQGDITAEFTNLDFYLDDYSTLVEFADYYYGEKLSFKNINMYGDITAVISNGYSLFVSWNNPFGSIITYENCKNYANVTANSTAAGIFCGYAVDGSNGSSLSFTNCENYGTFVNAHSAGYAGMLITNTSYMGDYVSSISIENCINYGTILGRLGTHLVAGILTTNAAQYKATNDNIESGIFSIKNEDGGICQESYLSEITASNGRYSLPQVANAHHYKILFAATYQGGNGAPTSIIVNFTEEQRSSIALMNYTFITGEDSLNIEGASPVFDAAMIIGDGNIYLKDDQYVLSNKCTESGGYITQKPTISYVAYSENGKMLAYYTFKK